MSGQINCRYSTLLKANGLFDIEKWLDVRGNHDSFIHYPNEHPYKRHTVCGSAIGSSVFSKTFQTDGGPLRFIGIDANRPLLRHFNGFLLKEDLDILEDLLLNDSMPTILFSHFPIFSLDMRERSSRNHSFKDILRIYRPRYYLCGHMHSALGGMIVSYLVCLP